MAKMNDPLSEKSWKGRISACQSVKQEFRKTWQDSVSYRRGKPFRSTPPDDTVNIPTDWSRTKNKQAQLFYQVPELVLLPRQPQYAGACAVFAAALNFQLTEHVHAEHMMNECLGDVINAAGIAICKVGYEGTFDYHDMTPPPQEPVAGMQPDQPQAAEGTVFPEGQPPATPGMAPEPVPIPVYECYYARRISPLHFLWPVEFVGSNWNEAPWLGWEGYMPVAEAQRRGWVDATFEGVQISDEEWLLIREYDTVKPTDKFVKFSEVFYRPSVYDPAEKDPRHLKRTVLVEGKEGMSQVVDEDFQWQRPVPDAPPQPPQMDPATGQPSGPPQPGQRGGWVGMTTFPIKVLHLSKISDLAIAPSDSEMGRPQVRELIKSRSQMIRQRDRSLPLRWFDVNQVDAAIGDRLRKGKYQDMIPMNGPGDRAIGEVARAAYPRENWDFMKVIKDDLDEAWSMGPAQQGIPTPGETTATEVDAMQGAQNVRLDFERQWVLRFFLEVATGIGQLMQLFADDTSYAMVTGPNGVQALQAWNKDTIAGEYVFGAKPDSQLRVDVQQKRTGSLNLYKLLRRDPLINPVALVTEVLELHGIDPSKTMAPQQPPKPQPPKIAWSFRGEDLVNPLVVALVQKSDSPVSPQDIDAAKKLIADVGTIESTQPPQPGAAPGGPQGPVNPGHPGPPEPVNPLNRRYAEQSTTGPEGSRDSGVPGQ